MGSHSVTSASPGDSRRRVIGKCGHVISTICSEQDWDCRNSFQNKSKGKVEALNSDAGSLPVSQSLSFLQLLSLAYSWGSQSHIGFRKPYGSQRDWAVQIPTLDTRRCHRTPQYFPKAHTGLMLVIAMCAYVSFPFMKKAGGNYVQSHADNPPCVRDGCGGSAFLPVVSRSVAAQRYLTFCSSCLSQAGKGCPSLCSSLESSTLCCR